MGGCTTELAYREGAARAGTLQKDTCSDFHFAIQSVNIPQLLDLLAFPDKVEIIIKFSTLKAQQNSCDTTPDHMHEGETLGFGGVETSKRWTLNDN